MYISSANTCVHGSADAPGGSTGPAIELPSGGVDATIQVVTLVSKGVSASATNF